MQADHSSDPYSAEAQRKEAQAELVRAWHPPPGRAGQTPTPRPLVLLLARQIYMVGLPPKITPAALTTILTRLGIFPGAVDRTMDEDGLHFYLRFQTEVGAMVAWRTLRRLVGPAEFLPPPTPPLTRTLDCPSRKGERLRLQAMRREQEAHDLEGTLEAERKETPGLDPSE